jgi:DNA-binding winged helix-turn-helix (wHTH) protein/tetratricopeptide (TPR) repeat protein
MTVALFGEFELDVDQFELRRAGTPVPMEPQVFEVLAYLVGNRERVVLKDELIGHIWPDRFISEAALNSRVMAARKAVGDNGKDQRLIRTIRSRGFRFVGDVRASGTDGARQDSPPAPTLDRSLDQTPGSAPSFGLDVAATSFVGRQNELARLDEMLDRPACRLVTIVGPGGVGKTRLAAEFVQRNSGRGREVVSVALHEVGSVHDLLVMVAGALGLHLTSVEPETIGAGLRGRNVLLLLDNFEHLAAHASAVLPTLLLLDPGLAIVVTSREVLGLREEWLFPVTGLGLGEEHADLSEAIELFLDREMQVGATHPGAPDAAVEQVCRLVDGMPLAIELAASLRRYLSRSEIAARLAESVGILQADVRNLPLRHRSVPGLIEESIARLNDEQRIVLHALSVFDGSFSSDAAAAVAGASLAALGDLVARSLVQPRHGRFALHPLLRQHSREQLGFGLEVRRRAHAEYFTEVLESRLRALEGAGQVAASAEIDHELPNILAAWRWACDNRRLDLLERAVYPLTLHAHLRSRFNEIRDVVVRACDVAERAGEEWWRVCASLQMARTWSLIRTTRGPEVIEALSRAEGLYRSHREPPMPGFGMDPTAIRAMAHWAGGRYSKIVSVASGAEESARDRGDDLGEAFALWLGAVGLNRMPELRWIGNSDRSGAFAPANALAQETIDSAATVLDRATSLLTSRGETWFLSFILGERSLNAKARGDSEQALALARRTLAVREQFGDARGVAEALITIADCHIDAADADGALGSLDRAEPIVQRLGDLSLVSEWERARSHIDWLGRNPAAALHRLAEVAELSLQIGNVNNIVAALRGMGDVYFDLGEFETAAELHAFVAGHPATMPFSCARAEAALAAETVYLGPDGLAGIRARMRAAHLPIYTAGWIERVRT